MISGQMKIPASITLDPHAANLAEQVATLPRVSGIYLLLSTEKRAGYEQFHLGWSANLSRRLARLLVGSDRGPDRFVARLRDNLVRVECWATGSRLETSLLMYAVAKSCFPDQYLKRLRLRMPWFVGLTQTDPFPRTVVVNRIPRVHGRFFGPFPTRDSAQLYEQEVLGLFQVRRCVERLNPHPDHPGCIYGEMNQCLRPCQGAVTQEEYATEASRFAEFMATNGRSLVSTLSAARDRASAQTDFEQAAYIHRQIEKVNAAAGFRDKVITEIQHLNGIALTHAVENRQLRLWPMIQGFWHEPLTLDVGAERARANSLDQELRTRISSSPVNVNLDGTRIEHLAVFARWYFSSWRDGTWYAFRTAADLDYRRLVREISKMAKAAPSSSV